MNQKPFFKQVNFYLAAAVPVLTAIAVILYAANCPSEFNGEEVSSAVVVWDVIAILTCAAAAGGAVAEYYLKGVAARIAGYLRFGVYAAFISLIVSFLMQILDEYSLLGTILYPIFSGTVGDPVDPVLSSSYFASLIMTLVACVLAITSALLKKSQTYRAEKTRADAV